MTQTEPMNGAEALLELFRIQGTDYIFCSPIAAWAPLWEALAKRKATRNIETPKYFNCRHEILAVGLAAGYYKATGRAQAVLLPTGLGVLHGSMAVRSAYHEHIPMVIVSPDTLSHGAIPTLDPGPEWPTLLVDLAGPVRNAETVTKWAKEVKTPTDLAPDLRRAWYFAESVPRGPTLVGVPFDILMSEAEPPNGDKMKAAALVAAPESLREVADILMRGKCPLIITEHGARTPDDRAALIAIAEHLGAPVFEYWMPLYVNFPRDHPLYAIDPVETHLKDADCILVIGAHGPWHPQETKLPSGCTVIQIEEDPLRPRAPYWSLQTDYAIAGDISANLAELAATLKARPTSADETGRITERTARWHTHNVSHQTNAKKERESARGADHIQAPFLFDTLHTLLPDGAVIVDEIIAQVPPMVQHTFRNRDISQIRGWAGALGTGIPTALGVKLARPNDVIVCVIGDGAFNYNPVPACLGLAQQYNVPILVIICNNEGYASQEWNLYKYFPTGYALREQDPYGKVIEPTPDYAALAPAFGAHGACITEPGKLEQAIRDGIAAVQNGKLALLDVRLRP
ncbi:MAG TPA: thiamine pyrophosphate-dependent enzyme [Acetobacteraceae bacterium]|jgi:acetolactate synthase-1/2/3 large subunit|nr:thiamine pyrophosphate-dependent enzyme [Acetobacteraceae bacterium]